MHSTRQCTPNGAPGVAAPEDLCSAGAPDGAPTVNTLDGAPSVDAPEDAVLMHPGGAPCVLLDPVLLHPARTEAETDTQARPTGESSRVSSSSPCVFTETHVCQF